MPLRHEEEEVEAAQTAIKSISDTTRHQALNAAKDRAGIPRSQSPSRQWHVGDDASRANSSNYRLSRDPATHGRYYEYDTPQGKRVIVDHTNDPARGPHMHAGQPKSNPQRSSVDFKNERYQQVGGRHHIDYTTGAN